MLKDIIFCIVSFILALIILALFAWGTSLQEELFKTQHELIEAVENLESESTKSEQLSSEIIKLTNKLGAANLTISTLQDTEYEFVYIGEFKITHYCTEKRKHICGTGNGITATGTQVTAGCTIAVDPEIIPYGAQVYIDGYGWRIAEDCGAAVQDRHIDMAVETHEQALSMGVKSKGVWVLVRRGT